MGVLDYVDDQFTVEYHMRFNPKKSKSSCYNIKCSHDIIVKLFHEKIEIVNKFLYLGNKLWKKNTTNIVQICIALRIVF